MHPPGAGPTSLLHPPATHDAIAEAELRLGAALPADYTAFLLHSNGASLVDTRDSGQPSIELLDAAALVRCAEEADWLDPAACVPELLVFARVGVEGDQLAFESRRMNPCQGCAVLDARRDRRPEQWWVIARDFADWLERVLTDPGPPGSFGRHWGATIVQPPLPLMDLLDED
jgi:hypothetical protein